jgi:hypothetical protein
MNAILLKLLSPSRLPPVATLSILLSLSSAGYADRDGHGGGGRGAIGHGAFRGGGERGRGFDHGRGFDRGRGFGFRRGFGFGSFFYGGYYPYSYGWPYAYGPGYDYYDDPYASDYDRPVYRGIPRDSGSDNLVVDVQRVLRRHGYYTGGIDGQAGPGTRGAIRAYQADRHLPVTGRIDNNLIRSLGLG